MELAGPDRPTRRLSEAFAEQSSALRNFLSSWEANQECLLRRLALYEGDGAFDPSNAIVAKGDLCNDWVEGGNFAVKSAQQPCGSLCEENLDSNGGAATAKVAFESHNSFAVMSRNSAHEALQRMEKADSSVSSWYSHRHLVFRRLEWLEGLHFNMLSALVITCNTIFIGYVAEYNINNIGGRGSLAIDAIELAFGCYYMIEVALRMLALGLQFIICYWNLFDVLVVTLWLVEVGAEMLQNTNAVSFTYLRIARMLKLVKLLRVVRFMRLFRELRLIVDSLLGSFRTMLWSIALIAMISFVFAVLFVQATTVYLADNALAVQDGGPLARYWSSVPTAMFTLYMSTTGGADWGEVAMSLKDAGRFYEALFCLYIAFWTLVLVNAMNALFIDSIMLYSAKDQNAVLQDKINRKQEFMSGVAAFYKEMDENKSGAVSFDEFQNHLADPRLAAFAASIDIDPCELEQFFTILSHRGKSSVDLDTFVAGCIKLGGLARSMDVMDVVNTSTKLLEDQQALSSYVADQFAAVRSMECATRGLLFDVHMQVQQQTQTSKITLQEIQSVWDQIQSQLKVKL